MTKQTIQPNVTTGAQLCSRFNSNASELYGMAAPLAKGDGEPIFFVVIGHSFVLGTATGTTESMPAIAGVKQWATTGSGSHAWRDFDGDAAELADHTADIFAPYCGNPGGGRGNFSYGITQHLAAQHPNNPVYILTCFMLGAPALAYADGQATEALLSQEINDALASTELTAAGVTAPDFVLMCHGHAEADQYTPFGQTDKKFADQVLANIEHWRGDWADKNTRFGIFDISYEWNHEQAYDAEDPPNAVEPHTWSGIYKLHQISGGSVMVFPFRGYETVAVDDIHPTGDASLQAGRDVARALLEGAHYSPAPLSDLAADPRGEVHLVRRVTTDDTQENVLVLPISSDTVDSYEYRIIGVRTDGGGNGISQATGTHYTNLSATNQVVSIFNVDITADNGDPSTLILPFGGSLVFAVTGLAGQTWHWLVEVKRLPVISP